MQTKAQANVQQAARFIAWLNARPSTPRRVTSDDLESKLYPEYTAAIDETVPPWLAMVAAFRRLRVRKRRERKADGSRPMVYTIPRPRRRSAEVLPLARRA
jgi:hypothetical protein